MRSLVNSLGQRICADMGGCRCFVGVGVRSARLVFADMTTDTGEQDGEGDDLVIALTPIQLGVVLAQIVFWVVIVLILRFRARRRRTN